MQENHPQGGAQKPITNQFPAQPMEPFETGITALTYRGNSYLDQAEVIARHELLRATDQMEIERLRQFESVCEGLPQDAIDGGWTVQGIRGYAKRLEERLAAAEERAAKLKREMAELEEELEEGDEAYIDAALRRDRAEEWADRLAERIGSLLGIEIGDHSSTNCPWENAWLALGQIPVLPLLHGAPEGWCSVLVERRWQVEAQGWTPEGDDGYVNGQLAAAAACYALWAAGVPMELWERLWPWDRKWLRYGTPRRMMVKAGALALAEIERLDRSAPCAGEEVLP
ncbi:hypothetical protein [Pseudomonas aeruginosa]|uniref:hypothetical protein n=1 Tax=Pseudomonas aeruginosa TaxID=287 RepID=UPI000FC416CE|nr:hypothetical protein [Pseudomonas aeruginosa]RUI34569.1 hypothetical protein IPC443_03575 [Pseudomonas aeruginosa]